MKKLFACIICACLLSFGCATQSVTPTPKPVPYEECQGSDMQCRGAWYIEGGETILFVDSECDGIIDRAVYGLRLSPTTMQPIQEIDVDEAIALVQEMEGLWQDCEGNPIEPLF